MDLGKERHAVQIHMQLDRVAQVLSEVESSLEAVRPRIAGVDLDSAGANGHRALVADLTGAVDLDLAVLRVDGDRATGSSRDLAREHVVVAHELGDELVAGVTCQMLRRTDLLHDRIAHDDDAVGHREGFFLVVRHVDKRDAELALKGAQLDAHAQLQETIEAAERLVEQDRLRTRDEHAGESDALLLAARELARLAVHHRGQTHEINRGLRLDLALRLVDALHLEAERDVIQNRLVREQRVMLEHRGDRAIGRRDAVHQLAVDRDGAAGRIVMAGDHAQRRRLATARRTEEDDILAVRNLEVDVRDCRDVAREDPVHVFQYEPCITHPISRFSLVQMWRGATEVAPLRVLPAGQERLRRS